VATCFPPSTTNCQQCSQHFGPSGTSAHTNSMLESRYREAKRCSASQHITLTLWEPEVYCRINKSLRLVTILSRTDPVHNLNFFFFTIQCSVMLQFMPLSPKWCPLSPLQIKLRIISSSAPGSSWFS
jgi:hypothetical protein